LEITGVEALSLWLDRIGAQRRCGNWLHEPGGNCLSPGPFFASLSRMRRFFLLFLMVVGWLARGAELKINFSDFAMGESPTNFHSALAGTGQPGDWEIVTDESPSAFEPLMPQITPTAPMIRRHVLAQLSRDPASEHFPMFIYDGEKFKNFKLTTEFKIISGAAEQMAGVVFRYQNASNFYVLRASALGHNVRFYKVVGGLRANPIGPVLTVTTNIWHTLAVQCLGDQITCWFDGKLLMPTLHDSSFDSGEIGFWTMSDAVSYFGDTTINYTPVVAPAELLVRDILKKYPRIVNLRIYMPDDKDQLRVIGSKDAEEIGQPATDAEKNTLEKGAIYYGHGKGTVSVDMPLNDRNGVPIAAVRVELKSRSFAETQDMVLARVRIIISEMQKQVLSKEDLTE
jgi:3-keto-disaccharide hydrolase